MLTSTTAEFKIKPVGDQAVSVEFKNEISLEVNGQVRALRFALEQRHFSGLLELIPSYRALLIHYDPLVLDLPKLEILIHDAAGSLNATSLPPAVVTEIPVLYQGEYAPDLDEIARIEHKTPDEIIKIHSGSEYYVYMLGFAPGHPYTARFENAFSFKRRETPRVKIPGGSIVVQLALSDIIPFDQPCGWNIIGTTPVLACDYRKANPFLLHAGQWIKHVPVSLDEFNEIKRQVELGVYECKTYPKAAIK